jgi:hypothetical protein
MCIAYKYVKKIRFPFIWTFIFDLDYPFFGNKLTSDDGGCHWMAKFKMTYIHMNYNKKKIKKRVMITDYNNW